MKYIVLTLAAAVFCLSFPASEAAAQRRGSAPATSASENRDDRAPERRSPTRHNTRGGGAAQVRARANPGPPAPPPCVETRRTWQEGRWVFRAGRRRWVAGHWVTRQVAAPCPPPPPGAGCRAPTLGPRAFEARTRAIAAESFESTRMTRARRFVSTNCLSAEQIRDLLMVFSFESSRLELAKIAYLRACDRRNYHLVFDALQFESSARELDAFIQSVGP